MKRPTMNRFRAAAHAAALATAFSVIDARAHEFWLDPVDFTPKAGETVPIMHRNGQNFEGDSYPFIRELSRRFTVVDGRGERDVKATEGEDPVAEVRFSQPGLSIVVYHRGPERLVHSTFAKFEETLLEEGLEAVVAEHKASRRPEKGIAETFWRCAKALIRLAARVARTGRSVCRSRSWRRRTLTGSRWVTSYPCACSRTESPQPVSS